MVLFTCGRASRANPADTYGLGSRAMARGGAVAADTSDFASTYYNPAGLVLGKRLRLSLGHHAVEPELATNGEPASVESFRASFGGLSVPGEIASLPVGLGVALHLSGDRLSRIVTVDENEARWMLHQDRPQQVYTSAAIALRPAPWLALGLGMAFLASTEGVLGISGRATQPGFIGEDGELTEYDSELDQSVVAELESERYPSLGLTLFPDGASSLAVVYRGESRVVLDVDAEFDGALGLGPLDLPTYYRLSSLTVQSFVPRQVVVGLVHRFLPETRVELDLQWVNWSAYVSPLSATESELSIDAQGLILDLPELPAPTALGSAQLADRVIPRLGVEHEVLLAGDWRWPLRAGYVFERTPLRARSSPNLLDADRHVASLGMGLHGPGPAPLLGEVLFDAHLQWSLFTPRSLTGPDGSVLRASGNILVFGFTAGVEL